LSTSACHHRKRTPHASLFNRPKRHACDCTRPGRGLVDERLYCHQFIVKISLRSRLEVEGGKLSEIETMTVRSAQEGMFFDVDALRAPSPAMNVVPTATQRESRDNAISIAEGYPAGLKIGSFVAADTMLAANAYRFENGRRMTGPGCTFQPPSCENMKAQRIPTLSGITYRVVAEDEELGLVLLRLDFGPGSVFGPGERWLHAWEAFKVYGGEIHGAEAFMRGMPANTLSGW
jgi:hypothetical protein